jgi:(E)-4-hydroxy-3-methylbut-2-enyl-diphosphate synthase
MDYCQHPYLYRRRPSRVVHVGEVALGGAEPIRIQSMTTPATSDIAATVEQMERLADAGCEIVRVTVPTVADAEHLGTIRAEMRRRRIAMPLVADIHFNPAAAMASMEHADKVRINPGNFVDSKRFEQREYTDAEYEAELARIAERFAPLVDRALELGVAIRVGTNHGSLSDRILNRYGDTPAGMVESALEYLRVARDRGFHDLVLSMKSSNPLVMIQAYRLLAARMAEEDMDYPFHLGVTEAGDGEDGRLKSAVGIGALLEDGIGDTIRVSLTEDPVQEIHAARDLLDQHSRLRGEPSPPRLDLSLPEVRDPYAYARRDSRAVGVGGVPWGGDGPPRVEVCPGALAGPAGLDDALAAARALAGTGVAEEGRPDLLEWDLPSAASVEAFAGLCRTLEGACAARLAARVAPGRWSAGEAEGAAAPLASVAQRLTLCCSSRPDPAEEIWRGAAAAAGIPLLWEVAVHSVEDLRPAVEAAAKRLVACREAGPDALVCLRVGAGAPVVGAYRLLAARLARQGLASPVVLLDQASLGGGEFHQRTAVHLGGLLCDGIGDAVRIEGVDPADAARLGFTLLQGTRLRLSRTEFISCPSCGRTLFDLESTTQRIKGKTGHLKGVKIAIMGCIVNGPGEMADADFGYVGGAPGKVNLFVGREMVARHVAASEADQRLIDLIKTHGKWVDPPSARAGERREGS